MVVPTSVVFGGEGFNRLTGPVSPTSAQDWGWRFESADRGRSALPVHKIGVGGLNRLTGDGQPYQCTRLGLEV